MFFRLIQLVLLKSIKNRLIYQLISGNFGLFARRKTFFLWIILQKTIFWMVILGFLFQKICSFIQRCLVLIIGAKEHGTFIFLKFVFYSRFLVLIVPFLFMILLLHQLIFDFNALHLVLLFFFLVLVLFLFFLHELSHFNNLFTLFYGVFEWFFRFFKILMPWVFIWLSFLFFSSKEFFDAWILKTSNIFRGTAISFQLFTAFRSWSLFGIRVLFHFRFLLFLISCHIVDFSNILDWFDLFFGTSNVFHRFWIFLML